MKKIVLLLLFILLLTACGTKKYVLVSENLVDGYYIYQKEQSGIFCNSYWEDVYYSGETYNYGYRYKGCGADMSYFILDGVRYVYLRDALEGGQITLDSLIPELMELDRNPEEFEDEADYYWLDYHIDGKVVYAYAGGTCEMFSTERFIIDGTTYTYSAGGCLKDNILFMNINGNYTPIQSLLDDGSIDGELLIPLLTEIED